MQCGNRETTNRWKDGILLILHKKYRPDDPEEREKDE